MIKVASDDIDLDTRASIVDVESVVVALVIIISRCCVYVSFVITQLFACLINLWHILTFGLMGKHHCNYYVM